MNCVEYLIRLNFFISQEEERKTVTQLKGPLMPIRQVRKRDKPRAITSGEKRYGAFSVLKQVCNRYSLISYCGTFKNRLRYRFNFRLYEAPCHRCAILKVTKFCPVFLSTLSGINCNDIPFILYLVYGFRTIFSMSDICRLALTLSCTVSEKRGPKKLPKIQNMRRSSPPNEQPRRKRNEMLIFGMILDKRFHFTNFFFLEFEKSTI